MHINAYNINFNHEFARSSRSKNIDFCGGLQHLQDCPVHLQVTQVWQSPQSPSVETHQGRSAWSRRKCTAPDPKDNPKDLWRSFSIYIIHNVFKPFFSSTLYTLYTTMLYVILYIHPFLFRAPSSAFDRQNHLLLWRWSTMTQRSCWWTYFNLNVQLFVAKLLICGSPNVPPHITHPSTVLSTPLPWWSNQNDGCQQSWHRSFLVTKASSKESIKGGQHTAIQVQNLCGV